MNYYIIKNKVYGFASALNPTTHNYQKLTENQTQFYEQHPNASIGEIINCTLISVSIPDYKKEKIQEIGYLSLSCFNKKYPPYIRENIVLGVYAEVEGKPSIQEVSEYGQTLRNEYYRLSTAIESANTKEEIDQIVLNSKYYENE